MYGVRVSTYIRFSFTYFYIFVTYLGKFHISSLHFTKYADESVDAFSMMFIILYILAGNGLYYKELREQKRVNVQGYCNFLGERYRSLLEIAHQIIEAERLPRGDHILLLRNALNSCKEE